MVGIYDIDKCSNLNYKKRLDIYKKVGFKEVALYIDNSYLNEGEDYNQIINYAKEIGLEVNQAHADYKISNLICDENSDKYFDYIGEKLSECYKLGIKNLVAHASMGVPAPKISDKQLKKLVTIIDSFANSDVCLCFENVKDNSNLTSILQLNHPQIKMCFDLGHAHCYDDEEELFEKYKDKIACSHLHNNFGSDTHNILTDGEIDFKPFVEKLKKLNGISNCLECFPPRGNLLNQKEFKQFVEEMFKTVHQKT